MLFSRSFVISFHLSYCDFSAMDFIFSRNSLTSPDPSLFPQFDSLNEVVHFLNSSLPSEAFSAFEKIRQHGQLCDVTIVVRVFLLISMFFPRLKENNLFLLNKCFQESLFLNFIDSGRRS